MIEPVNNLHNFDKQVSIEDRGWIKENCPKFSSTILAHFPSLVKNSREYLQKRAPLPKIKEIHREELKKFLDNYDTPDLKNNNLVKALGDWYADHRAIDITGRDHPIVKIKVAELARKRFYNKQPTSTYGRTATMLYADTYGLKKPEACVKRKGRSSTSSTGQTPHSVHKKKLKTKNVDNLLPPPYRPYEPEPMPIISFRKSSR